MRVYLVFTFFLLLAGLGPVQAQRSRTALERERRENQKRIEETTTILNETEKERTASLGQLAAVQQQLEQRRKLIGDLNAQVNQLQDEIGRLGSNIVALQSDVAALKKEYTAMVYAASKASVINRLMFLVSSETFHQFLRRLNYLKQYSAARKEQVAVIEKVQVNLAKQEAVLRDRSHEKRVLLAQQIQENQKLVALEGQQKTLVTQLGQKSAQLKQELDERREADQRLEKLIADMVKREMRRAARAARGSGNAGSSSSSDPDLTPEARMISTGFHHNRGRLLWPVERGFISQPFGRQPHPVLKHIMIENLGVDIQTSSNSLARSVYDGEVAFVATIPGVNGRIVSVMHGEYFTVYCNLKSVDVKVGEKINAKQKLGEIMTDKDGVTMLQFQVWKGSDRLDPEEWLLEK